MESAGRDRLDAGLARIMRHALDCGGLVVLLEESKTSRVDTAACLPRYASEEYTYTDAS